MAEEHKVIASHMSAYEEDQLNPSGSPLEGLGQSTTPTPNLAALFLEDEYTDQDKERMMRAYEATLMDVSEHRIVRGTITAVDDREVVINIGFKSEGIVPISEFKDIEDLKPGDEVEVYLETIENKNGQMVLSRRQANSMRTWERINGALDEDIIMEGIVKRRTKGGFVVDLEGIEAFLPGSQIDVKPIRDYDYYVGQRMEFKVVKINHAQKNVVISHKALIEKDLEAQKAEIINNLERGQVLEGEVKNITNFGVFIDLGGVDGLLHITDISWGRINSPEEVLSLGQRINVVVLDFDDEKKRISLGLKQLTPHPWDSLTAGLDVNSRVKGRVVTIADYGIFIEITPGVEGLIHVSEMSWSTHPKNPNELFYIGQEVEAVVLTLDREERKMSLGIKQLTEDPWLHAASKYTVGSIHTGIVRNLTNYGLFVELEEGIDGFIHVQDLSWNKKINQPSEFVQKDQKLETVVLEIDLETRKIRLGHKQLTEDPWETLESVFPEGSLHTATITKLSDKSTGGGAVVELEYGVEGFIPAKHLKAEDGTTEFKEGDTLQCKVIEFSKENRRIVLSHSRVWQDLKKAEDKKKGSAAKAAALTDALDETGGDYTLPEVQKSTFAEIAGLADLRSKFSTDEPETTAEVTEAAAETLAQPAETIEAAAEAVTEAAAETLEASTEAVAEAAAEATEAVAEAEAIETVEEEKHEI